MNEQAIIALFRKYDAGDFSEADSQLFWDWCQHASLQDFEHILRLAFPDRNMEGSCLSEQRRLAIEKALDNVTDKDKATVVRMFSWRIAAAAAVLLLLLAGGYMLTRLRQTQVKELAVSPTDIQPGKQGAVLMLANGQQVLLDSMPNGVISQQQGTQVVLQNGKVVYHPVDNAHTTADWNTISTPRARQYTLVLPDGSRVWLDAASSIRFPVNFSGRERKVIITGEVYFDIAANAQQPFKVAVGEHTEINVLGTSFNVNAYPDEGAIRTTLLSGAVAVRYGQQQKVLVPGQQGSISTTDSSIVISKPDLDKVLAWKNGLFNFEDADFKEVMRQLSRWYDIEVVYQGAIPDKRFEGKLSRDISLNGVLKILEEEKIQYKLEGHRLIILP